MSGMRPRRHINKGIQLYVESSSDSEDEADLIYEQIQRKKRRNCSVKTPKSANMKKTCEGIASSSKCSATRNLPCERVQSQDCVVLDKMNKMIASKVDKVFQESNLLSDEDDIDIIVQNVEVPQTASKEFYVLSDSDEESNKTIPSVSPVTSAILPEDSVTEEPQDELMDLVNEILDCDSTPVNVNVETDKSWTEYKKKAEELLSSVSSLLDDIKPVEKPSESKPSCPICLEPFGDSVKAATTLCGHIFCYTCINQVCRSTKKCPTCRKTVTAKKIHAIYF